MLFSCTPSRLATFDCPRRYRFTYLDKPRPPKGTPWAHNSLGAAVHLALARWWSLPLPARTPDVGERLVEREWLSEGFKDDAQSQRYRDVAARWVRDYLVRIEPDVDPIGVERTVAFMTDRLAVSGRVDRIDERDGSTPSNRDVAGGGELVIVDYKSGRRGVSEDEARGSQALALYVLGTRRALRRASRRVELHHLPTGEVAAFEHTDDSLARHVARAEATAQDIVVATDTLESGADPDEVFPAAPSAMCSWCDFRAHCPAGQAAAKQITPWAGLPELG
ncbi:MAG: RecB family exonuclease [Jatrophihabitantaceae bacterium]